MPRWLSFAGSSGERHAEKSHRAELRHGQASANGRSALGALPASPPADGDSRQRNPPPCCGTVQPRMMRRLGGFMRSMLRLAIWTFGSAFAAAACGNDDGDDGGSGGGTATCVPQATECYVAG